MLYVFGKQREDDAMLKRLLIGRALMIHATFQLHLVNISGFWIGPFRKKNMSDFLESSKGLEE